MAGFFLTLRPGSFSCIDEHFGGQVAVLGGLSLGGRIALEILPGLKHGDLSLNHPSQYARMVKEWSERYDQN